MNRTIATVLFLIALPPAYALYDAVSFHVTNRNNGVLISSGVKREYLLYVPRSIDRTTPAPLVISMHGAGGWPTQQMEMSEWNRVADREHFIVVYPAGEEGNGPRVWHVERGEGLAKDVRFISDLIDEIAKSHNIDRRRIYANGFSNGGGMTFALSCVMSDRIAAFGMVGAAQTLPWRWCSDKRAVPAIIFHGTSDPVAPYGGGESWVSPGVFPSTPMWAKNWAIRNRCDREPVESTVKADVALREYVHCADDASVMLYTVRNGGHSWPGGEQMPEWLSGGTTKSIDASRVMWSFFAAHPLR